MVFTAATAQRYNSKGMGRWYSGKQQQWLLITMIVCVLLLPFFQEGPRETITLVNTPNVLAHYGHLLDGIQDYI